MNDTTRESRQALAAVERVQRLHAAQRAASLAQPYPSLAERKSRLQALKRQLQRYQDLLADAMSRWPRSFSAVQVAMEAIQCLGGNGYINDYPTARILRDAKLYDIGAGTNEIRRMLIGREIFEATA